LGQQQRRDSKQRGDNAGANERDHRKRLLPDMVGRATSPPREHGPESTPEDVIPSTKRFGKATLRPCRVVRI
jgi:hypothetical protein